MNNVFYVSNEIISGSTRWLISIIILSIKCQFIHTAVLPELKIFFLVNRSHVYIGFAGLFLGSGVGFLIGISVKPSSITVTHMKAVSATNYNGTEVILNMFSIIIIFIFLLIYRV